jgi:fumarate hydratase class II
MEKPIPVDEVEIASDDSFPASDPPSWTLGSDLRVERDSMGEVHVPRGVLYGPQTQRAVDNFPIGPHRLQARFIQALGLIKACAARANGALGCLPIAQAEAIAQAADKIAAGEHFEEFVVDVFQTGSGTSTNMNANEVIGAMTNSHPNDHVNRSQSSNDVIPSAIHVATVLDVEDRLRPAMELLCAGLEEKAAEFAEVLKIGRTHLQDATPVRLGQEFSGYAHQVRVCGERISAALEDLYELPLGGTAVGTGADAPPDFAARTIEMIAERTGQPFVEARNHFEAQAAKDAVLFFSGALRTYAIALSKIANDIRWLASGPRGGIGEIRLPAVQPGSSIMPGKVNPVIAESVLMVCTQVIGHDAAIAWGCAAGNFELNTMMPLIAYDLLDSIELLSNATHNFATRCVDGLEVNADKAGSLIEQSLALATALVPEIGYDKAAAIAKQAFDSGQTIRQTALERSGLAKDKIDQLLDAYGSANT